MKTLSHDKQIFKNRWAKFTLWSVVVVIVNITSFFITDRDLGISFAQNIAAEALGTVASIIFIQRYVDIANQKEADQTKEMITSNLSNLRSLMTKRSVNRIQKGMGRRQHSITDYSPRKQNHKTRRRRANL